MIIYEKLEDIPKGIKKKWYDIFNMQLRKSLRSEFKRIFDKYFKLKHPLIDSKKTKIDVSLPLIGYTYHVDIRLYDRKGNLIFDMNHPDNYLAHPLNVQYMRKNNKWEPYYHSLFLLPEYQNKGIGKKVVIELNKCTKELQNTKTVYYQGVSIGRYMISRIKGSQFKNKIGRWSADHVDINYKNWCYKNDKEYKKLTKPMDYPKEYLISRDAPEFIDYLVPI